MQKFNEWLKNKILKEEQSKDAIQSGQDWKCPNCEKPLTENELSKSVCSGCWKTFMPRNLTWYGLGKPEVRNPYSPTMPLGSRTWQKTTDMFYPRRRENPYFSLKEKSLVARASDSETATKPL